MIVTPLVWFLPAYVANPSATLSRLLRRTHPVDMGIKIGGERLLGDGKTIEGTLIGVLLGTVTGLLLFNVLGFPNPTEAFLMSVGSMFGDMLGSFVKRRTGIPRGGEATLIDQIDFVFGAFLFVPPPPDWGVIILAVTPVLHRVVSVVGYWVGVKREPW